MVDNIIIGTPNATEEELGIHPDEITIRFTRAELENNAGEIFLPNVLKEAGIFKSTSQIKQVNAQRITSKKIQDPLSRNLWRNLNEFEFTYFKIGKLCFWLIVGDSDE